MLSQPQLMRFKLLKHNDILANFYNFFFFYNVVLNLPMVVGFLLAHTGLISSESSLIKILIAG